jgi:hypothetical protein
VNKEGKMSMTMLYGEMAALCLLFVNPQVSPVYEKAIRMSPQKPLRWSNYVASNCSRFCK